MITYLFKYYILSIFPVIISGNSEILIISFPKCGRTWLRLLIGRILQQTYHFSENDMLNIEKMSRKIKEIPNLTVLHEDNPHLKRYEQLSKSKNKYKDKKIIFLARNPKDVIVSWYFHRTKRKLNKNYQETLSNFLTEKKRWF
ncbi:sulfotransferase domain-containing protein [Candidatus Pacearchaeota archaeon]|nr:sulfotransferase domain-containing protein [Candidatus Pacearchaeota archaeon]